MPATVARVLVSKYMRLKALQDMFHAVGSDAIWDAPEQQLLLLVPSIESSLMLQGGDSTLADVVSCRCGRHNRLFDAIEFKAIGTLESRWAQMEQSLLLIAFCFHLKNVKYAVDMMISEEDIARFLRRYALRWESLEVCDLEMSLAVNIVSSWTFGTATWAHDCEKFGGSLGSFWAQVKPNQKKKTFSTSSIQLILLREIPRRSTHVLHTQHMPNDYSASSVAFSASKRLS